MIEKAVELGPVIISLLAAVAALGHFAVARRQSTVLCEQLAESRLDSPGRRENLSAAIRESLDGSVRTSHVNFPYGVPVISVSDEPDSDGIAHVADLVKRYGHDDFMIDVLPDLV